MEVFGIVGMGFGVFGLLAWIQLQNVAKELAELKKALRESGALEGEPDAGMKK